MTGREATISADALVNRVINNHLIAVFTLSYCKTCHRLKTFFKNEDIRFYNIDIDEHHLFTPLLNLLVERTHQASTPYVYIRKIFVGDYKSIIEMYHDGTFVEVLEGKTPSRYDFEVLVIGGGCGGLSVAKEAAQMGKKVALFDAVAPGVNGSTWTGLGGTCFNSGCVPKKLMYQASLIGDFCEDGKYFGWNFEFNKAQDHNWREMISNIHKYIKKLNIGFKRHCSSHKIRVFNATVLRFLDSHTIEAEDKGNKKARFTSQVFVISTGGRPKTLDIPGSEFAITSDDLFSLPERPGKTLLIGSGVIGLECAGFLNGLGIDCTVLVRSGVLKKMDSQIAELITSQMKSIGIKFIDVGEDIEIVDRTNVNRKDKKPSNDSSKKLDSYASNSSVLSTSGLKYEIKVRQRQSRSGSTKDLLFDTILLAVGRQYSVTNMDLQQLGVKFNSSNGKIRVNQFDRTDCYTIFAIGDVVDERPELAPVAVKAGCLLARRMFGFEETMNYDFIPMALFTPLEYGYCGYTEESAIEMFGEGQVMIYQNRFHPLEWAMQQRNQNRCYAKLVCLKSDNFRVIGSHILGPSAAEIIQGFAFAMKLNGTRLDLEGFLGIFPTSAEGLFKIERGDDTEEKNLKATGSLSSMLI